MQMVAAVNHWIHLMSVVIWLGGILFFSHILVPVIKKSLPKESADTVLFETYRKFLKMSWILMILIVITGGINFHFVRVMDPNGLSSRWVHAFMLKLILVSVLATIFLLNLMNIRPGPDGKGKLEELPFQRTALLVSILILFLAAILRYSH
jgi:putative copper export protein